MLRYENEGISILIKLPKTDYTARIVARWDNEKKAYICTTSLSRNDIAKFAEIHSMNTIISSSAKDIKCRMALYVTDKFYNHEFDKEIDLYEYEDKCFNVGLDIIETKKNAVSKEAC